MAQSFQHTLQTILREVPPAPDKTRLWRWICAAPELACTGSTTHPVSPSPILPRHGPGCRVHSIAAPSSSKLRPAGCKFLCVSSNPNSIATNGIVLHARSACRDLKGQVAQTRSSQKHNSNQIFCIVLPSPQLIDI